jgi:hypothetical protein
MHVQESRDLAIAQLRNLRAEELQESHWWSAAYKKFNFLTQTWQIGDYRLGKSG